MSLPETIEKIGPYSFAYSGLESVILPPKMTVVPYAAFECCSELTSVTLNEGLESNHWFAFWGCDKLTTITLPESLSEICGASLPSSLTSIHAKRKSAAPILVKHYLPGVYAPVFVDKDYARCSLYVPKGYKNKYESTEWGHFKTIVEE